MKRIAIVTVATGGYASLTNKLVQSCTTYVPNADVHVFHDVADVGAPSHADNPYAFKIFAIEKMRALGYEVVIWFDSPNRVIASMDPWLADVSRVGAYIQVDETQRIGTWANDRALDYFGFTRDEVIDLPAASASTMGFDFRNPLTEVFFSAWKTSMLDGIFKGKWKNDDRSESQDPRCRGHRHDQTCAELVSLKLGMPLQPNVYGRYAVQWRNATPETGLARLILNL